MKRLQRQSFKAGKLFDRQALIMIAVVLAAGGIFGLLVLRSSATTPTQSLEPETGVISGNAGLVTDASASNNRAVKFSAPTAATPITNLPAQSAAIVYNTNMTNVSSYARPGGLVVAGRDNYQNQAFKDVSAAGGSVLMYLDVLVDNNYGTYATLLYNASACGPAVPRWPGSPQANEYGYLTDFRVGGVLQGKLECVLNKMVADNPHMAGFFADDLGSRSYYPDFNWDTWGTTNQQAYRDGAIAAVQTFRKVANEHGLFVMVNGTWGAGSLASTGGGYPNMAVSGNSLADGGFVEHHDASQLPYFSAYACSSQWASQSPVTRGKAFMYAVTVNDTDRAAYVNSGCYAYVATQNDYAVAPAPYSTLHATGLPSKVGGAVSF